MESPAEIAPPSESPASIGQRLLQLMDHYRGDGNGLNEQVVWRLPAGADPALVPAVVTRLVARHAGLRTCFAARGPRLTQRVLAPAAQPVTVVDVAGRPDPQAEARAILAREVREPIDVTRSPVRAILIRTGPQHHVLALTMHHFVTDDWSNGLIGRDLRVLHAELAGLEPAGSLPEIGWQYPDWSRWHHEQVRGDNLRRLTGYWQGELEGARLPDLRAVPAADRPAGPAVTVAAEQLVGAATVAGLRLLARRNRCTAFPVLLALFYLTLHRRLGQRDQTVATLLANRARPEVRDCVGFFASMVLLRARIDPGATFVEFLGQVRRCTNDAIRHQDLPYQLLPNGGVDARGGRADDVVFQLLGSFVERADMSQEGLDDLEGQLDTARFALEFILVPQGDDLIALLMSTGAAFGPAWAEGFVADYAALARSVVDDPEATLATLDQTGRNVSWSH